MTAQPLFFKEAIEGGAGVFRCVRGFRTGKVEGPGRRVERAAVARILVRDAGGDRPRAFEASRRVKGRALTAGVEIRSAAGTCRIRPDVFQVAQLLSAGAADEDDGLVLIGSAPAGTLGPRWPRARRP